MQCTQLAGSSSRNVWLWGRRITYCKCDTMFWRQCKYGSSQYLDETDWRYFREDSTTEAAITKLMYLLQQIFAAGIKTIFETSTRR
jgi:hypothetical protein